MSLRWLACAWVALGLCAAIRAAEPLHHWTFDADEPPARRTEGVFGQALDLSGQHHLRVQDFDAGKFEQISFSAWVLPTDLSSYREIFRKEDGDQRILFSFQDNGRILSLGLNIDGYIECDAAIDPKQVLDGQWHHAAATFDGQVMRVYLDGREIGSLNRPGRIRAGGNGVACIASTNGGECFHGSLDELRIYSQALAAKEIADLYGQGQAALDRRAGVTAEMLAALYPRQKSFPQTLMALRKNLAELKPPPRAAQAALRMLRSDFAADCDRLTQLTGIAAAQLVRSDDPELNTKLASRLFELMNEYRPLTTDQWRRQSADELAKWKAADAISAKFEQLRQRGADGRFDPAWIDLLLQAGGQIQHRPMHREAVAPYVPPSTPPTRDLTAAEAQAVLEKDYLHQAWNDPTPQRIADEIRWTRRLGERIARGGRTDFTADLRRLDELAAAAAKLAKSDRAIYLQVRQIKRRIMLANPVLDFEKVLFIDMPYPAGSEWQHETRHRLGYMAVPGARLLMLSGLSPAGHLSQLMPQSPLHGSFWRPDLSFDAKSVLFSFKPHNEKAFHLYEINLDGTGLRQLTDGIYDDLDPIYLPDEKHIAFTTTRGHSYVRCMPPTNAFVLARARRDGKEIYLISANNEPDYLPSVLHDGRIVYTRWEYTDKPLWRAQKLWTVNPDGTQVTTLWGNQSVWPDLVKDARAIPGSRRVMMTGSAHHNFFSGSVGIIDPDRGLNFPDGLTKVTADVTWPECGNGPVDPIENAAYHRAGEFPAYYSPYPLSETDFLVSAQRGGKFRLYLMDVEGNRELIYEGAHNIFHAIPVRARPKPPAIADRVQWPDRADREAADGVIFSSDVTQGAPAELRGKAKSLRIWHIDPKTYTYWDRRPYISTGPVVSVVQSEGVKRLLGTVPVEADGSVNFKAPAGKALHFQLLDQRGRALQTMRSFVNVMPGEYRGCMGCHEAHSRAPEPRGGMALLRSPSKITPPEWEDTTVSYPRYVQPVFDRYCNDCHAGKGEAAKVLDLSDRKGALGFAQAYHTLTGHPTWGQPYRKPDKAPPGFGWADMLMIEGYSQVDPAAYRTPAPMTAMSYRSRLIELCANGEHYKTRVDDLSLQRLIAWVDAMCPYNGEEEIRAIEDPSFPGIDWLSVRPRIRTAPQVSRPGPVD